MISRSPANPRVFPLALAITVRRLLNGAGRQGGNAQGGEERCQVPGTGCQVSGAGGKGQIAGGRRQGKALRGWWQEASYIINKPGGSP